MHAVNRNADKLKHIGPGILGSSAGKCWGKKSAPVFQQSCTFIDDSRWEALPHFWTNL